MKAFISELTALAVVIISSICFLNIGEATIPHELNAGEIAVATEGTENFSAVKTTVDENDSHINTNADANAIAVNYTAIASSSLLAESYTNGAIWVLKALLIWTIPFYMRYLLRI